MVLCAVCGEWRPLSPLAVRSPACVDGDAWYCLDANISYIRKTGSARYPQFYLRLWHNVLTLFIVPGSPTDCSGWCFALERAIQAGGHPLFSAPFSFETEAFIYVTIGLITALAVILARTQSRLCGGGAKLLTLIATGLLPVVSLLALLFIVTLPLPDWRRFLRVFPLRVAIHADVLMLLPSWRDCQRNRKSAYYPIRARTTRHD